MSRSRYKLTLNEQRKILSSLSPSRKLSINKVIRAGSQKGEGIGDILTAVMKVLGPIAKSVGPVVLKEMIVPLINKLTTDIGRKIFKRRSVVSKLKGRGKTKAKRKSKTQTRKSKTPKLKIAKYITKGGALRLPGSGKKKESNRPRINKWLVS